jgi:hypothetical protein
MHTPDIYATALKQGRSASGGAKVSSWVLILCSVESMLVLAAEHTIAIEQLRTILFVTVANMATALMQRALSTCEGAALRPQHSRSVRCMCRYSTWTASPVSKGLSRAARRTPRGRPSRVVGTRTPRSMHAIWRTQEGSQHPIHRAGIVCAAATDLLELTEANVETVLDEVGLTCHVHASACRPYCGLLLCLLPCSKVVDLH